MVLYKYAGRYSCGFVDNIFFENYEDGRGKYKLDFCPRSDRTVCLNANVTLRCSIVRERE